MIAEFSVVPLGKSTESLSDDVARAVQIIEDSGLPYQLTAMGTIIEGNWDEVMEVIRKAHHELRQYYPRVLTRIAIDDREDTPNRLQHKVSIVQSKLRPRA